MANGFKFPKLPPGCRVGAFILGEQLSSDGNMARIYRAFTRDNRRCPVAVKIARSDDETFDKLLRTEAEMLVNLRHPGIVHIYPIQLDQQVIYIGRSRHLAQYFNGRPPWYYAMEILSGGSVESHYRSRQFRALPLEWKLELIYQVAVVLDYLHSAGIAHRDLKMANVVFRRPPGEFEAPQPVLIDFGIAAKHRWRPMEKAGTLSHLSPERVEDVMGVRARNYRTTDGSINHLPSDVWALGVMSYEILTGQYPFEPYKSAEELADNILNRNPPSLVPKTPPEVERIVFGMLAKVREQRPPISEVIRMLDTKTPFLPPRVNLQPQ